MFDIGFWELVVIGVVALVVLGPDRLPQLARRAGYWIGRARRQLNEIRSEIEREIAMDEVRRASREMQRPLNELTEQVRSASSFGQRVWPGERSGTGESGKDT
ncbi:MAG: Sec-independent protein translocase protein TatB [Chromatiales bacterium]